MTDRTNLKITNVLIAGVGGQGLVLSTKILGMVAFLEGYDVKTSDVIGLSQRGGKIFGSVRFGEVVPSPLIPMGQCDILLGMEKLEALRWAPYLHKESRILLNDLEIYPNRVLTEKEAYPESPQLTLSTYGTVHLVDAYEKAKAAGNEKTSNTVLLGALSRLLPFAERTWLQVISESVPIKTIDMNLQAFRFGADALEL